MADSLASPIVRFVAVLAIAVLAMALLERRWHVLARFRQETTDAPDLAIARITVMVLILWQTRLPLLLAFAHLDPALIVPPRGWSHLTRFVPLQPSVIVGAYGLLMVTAALGLVGWKGRFMCGISALLAFYLHTIPQLFGKVNHTANHLVLFSALLAAAPSCDALAIDAARSPAAAAGRGLISRRRAGRAYSFAQRTMMLAIGLAYFFPGAWKVARAGGRWFTSDNLSWLILSKLQEMPMTQFQHWLLGQRSLLWCMAVGTVAFELGLVFVVLIPRLRVGAALAGVTFHAFTVLVMGINFTALQLTYVVLVPWTRYLPAMRRVLRMRPLRVDVPDLHPVGGAGISPGLRATAAVILSGMALAGSTHLVRTWPVACYPTFDVPSSPTVDQLAITAVDRTGQTQDWSVSFDSLMGRRFGTERWRGLTETFIDSGTTFDSRRAKALLDAWQEVHATPPLRSAVFFADTYSLEPGSNGSAPRRRFVGAWAADPDGRSPSIAAPQDAAH